MDVGGRSFAEGVWVWAELKEMTGDWRGSARLTSVSSYQHGVERRGALSRSRTLLCTTTSTTIITHAA